MVYAGDWYDSVDEEFIQHQHEMVQRLNDFNNTPDTEKGLVEREKILREIMGTYGEGLYIIPPISANCGLHNVHAGKNVVINFNVSLVDDGDIYIGDDTIIEPNVVIMTAMHPISPRLRRHKIQYNKPVHIGNNVWIGPGAIIMPGVSIGDDAVVEAGSIVNQDVKSGSIVAGNPVRVKRYITERDDSYYEKNQKIPQMFVEKYLK